MFLSKALYQSFYLGHWPRLVVEHYDENLSWGSWREGSPLSTRVKTRFVSKSYVGSFEVVRGFTTAFETR